MVKWLYSIHFNNIFKKKNKNLAQKIYFGFSLISTAQKYIYRFKHMHAAH